MFDALFIINSRPSSRLKGRHDVLSTFLFQWLSAMVVRPVSRSRGMLAVGIWVPGCGALPVPVSAPNRRGAVSRWYVSITGDADLR
jgi:hypothetical protein